MLVFFHYFLVPSLNTYHFLHSTIKQSPLQRLLLHCYFDSFADDIVNRFTFVNGPIIPIRTSLQPTSPPVNTTQWPQSNSDLDVHFRGLYFGLIFGVWCLQPEWREHNQTLTWMFIFGVCIHPCSLCCGLVWFLGFDQYIYFKWL